MERDIPEGYEELAEKLPPLPEIPEGDEKRFQELKKEAEALRFYEGPEADGLNLAVAARREEIMAEAQKYCHHDLQVRYHAGYTVDGRRRLIRECFCEKCGLFRMEEAREELSIEAFFL